VSQTASLTWYLTQCNAEKLVKEPRGEMDIEGVLQRLDRLIRDEAPMTTVQTLEAGGCLLSCLEYEGGDKW
jgi:hypothetical protein